MATNVQKRGSEDFLT